MELIPGLPNDISRECLTRLPYKHFSKFLSLSKQWKQEIESVEFHQRRKANASVQTLIMFAQADPEPLSASFKYPATPVYGLSIYEPAIGKWSRLPAPPGWADGLPVYCHLVRCGRCLVVIGGLDLSSWKASSSVLVFDFLSGMWKRGNDMPGPPRLFFGCASDLHETVFVAGGHDEEKNALRSAMAYNVRRDEWVSLADMARERDECKGVFYGGKFHVIGGYCTDKQGQFAKSAEAFDAMTSQWRNVEEDYLIEKGICPSTCVIDGNEAKVYKCVKDHLVVRDCGMWQSFVELPSDVCVGPFCMTWQGKILVIGSDVLCGSHRAYMLDMKGDKRSYKWTKIETPNRFTGKVLSGCSLEI